MANLSTTCSVCGKKVITVKETVSELFKLRFLKYDCGHTVSIPLTLSPTAHIEKIVAANGHKLFPYQIKTIDLVEKAGLQAIINHEMGVGKTVIANGIIELHPEILPCLIICPAGLTRQWWNHVAVWNKQIAQILTTKAPTPLFDFYKIFIVSVDSLFRLPWMATISAKESQKMRDDIYKKTGEYLSYDEIVERADNPGYREIRKRFKHIFVDEVQKIKNPTAQRTQAVKRIGGGKTCITLSGTPIKNNAKEYYPALNLVRPDLFKTEDGYVRRFVRTDSYGKAYGMKNVETFQEITKDWIFRYERKDVLPDLPLIFRQFRSAEMQNDDAKEAYEQELNDFTDFMDTHSTESGNMNFQDMTNILGYFARMRHITGLSKVDPCVEYIEQFLLETDRKITIFMHHKDVMETLQLKLDALLLSGGYEPCQTITSDKNSEERMAVIEKFRQPANRILLASTLAAGEGINLQFCSDCIILERQWNPANEEQAEARFPRPGNLSDKINAVYMIVPGTIDDMLTELVERKRAVMSQVLDGRESDWNESTLMRELTDALYTKGKAKWQASLI